MTSRVGSVILAIAITSLSASAQRPVGVDPIDSLPLHRPSTLLAPTPAAPGPWRSFKVWLGDRFSWWDENRTFTFFDENDAFGGTSDSSYTQGIRLHWNFNVWPNTALNRFAIRHLTLPAVGPGSDRIPTADCDTKSGRARRPCGNMSLSIMQTEYTPPDLLKTARDPGERPYAGYLAASMGTHALYERSAVSVEATVGVTGPWSGAAETQSLAHWTWAHSAKEPLGWHNQIENAVHGTIRSSWVANVAEFCRRTCSGAPGEGRIFDVLPDAEVVLGTFMRRASMGVTAHFGYGFPDMMTPLRIPTSAPQAAAAQGKGLARLWDALTTFADSVRSQWWVVGTMNLTQRRVGMNSLIEGSYADGGKEGWRSVRKIELEPWVSEKSIGWAVGTGTFSLGHQLVERSSEYRPGGGAHTFGVFTLSLTSGKRANWP
jgi:lipid A 3-O-deacylase